MTETVVMTLIAAGYVLWRRSSWRYATTLGSESSLSCLHPWYGDNLFHYYKSISAPLSFYIFSTTLRRSIPHGRDIYLSMLAAQSVFLQIATWQLFGAPAAGLAAGVCYLLYTVTPTAFFMDMQPEAHGYFFASLGLMLTAVGLSRGWDWLVYLGVFTGSLSFHCKITLQDGLGTLAAILCVREAGPLFWTGCLIWIGSGLLFIALVLLGEVFRHENDRRAWITPSVLKKLLALFRFVRSDLEIRYPGKSGTSIGHYLNQYLGYHVRIVWPLAIMTLAAVIQGLFTDRQLLLLALLVLIPMAQCAVRLNYQPLYAFMIHFPLAVGTGVFLVGNAEAITAHPVAGFLALALTVAAVMLTVRENTVGAAMAARTKVIKEHVLDPIRDKVGPDDYVFQDSWMVLVYLELSCLSPNMSFVWADRIRALLAHQSYMDNLTNFFIENKPKYFIAHQKHFNLDYLEQLTGLRYALRNTVYAYVYERISVEPPSGERGDAKALFDNPEPRYALDAKQTRKMIEEVTQ